VVVVGSVDRALVAGEFLTGFAVVDEGALMVDAVSSC
jgi:hypothetical protein